jgi:carbon monoxide dehydrogenase subunit G
MQVSMTKHFIVNAPIQAVWAHLSDIEKVTHSIPGAHYGKNLGDNNHSVNLTVKVGPIKSSYRSEVTVKSLDESTHTLEIAGKGVDTKGKGGANMEMVGKMTDNGDGSTAVTGTSTVTIQGMLAQFGSRMIEDVSNQLFSQFTESLCAKLEKNEDSEEMSHSEDNSLSGTAVAGAAIKGITGRIMGIFKKENG